MTEEQKKAIIESGKNYFRASIIPNHIKNLQKLMSIQSLSIILRLSFVVTLHHSQWRKPWFIRVFSEQV